jgi:hypothetical protein
MRVGVIQSSYIPWRGYFDFIASVDTFVFHDDIQYTKGDWRNRNRIKTGKGAEWLTVPVHYKSVSQLICETSIDNSKFWGDKHLRQFHENYHGAKYVSDALDIFSYIKSSQAATISELNIELTKRVCEYLKIATPMLLSTDLSLIGTKTERLIDLLRKLNANTYLSGPSADFYLDREAFCANGIQLEYKSYDYAPYPQLWGAFDGAVSVLDMIANCGPQSKSLLHSATPNRIVIT